MIIKSDYRIASLMDGHGLLLRNKHINDEDHRVPENSVLFVHGATYGSTVTFDYAVEGESWMDCMAVCGFDSWCLDLLGYGESDRPAIMSAPAGDNPPMVDTDHAVQELDRAVDFICRDRGVDSVSLIGYSWGSAICGRYAGLYPGKVNSLVLSGALWVEKSSKADSLELPHTAYRTVDVDSMIARWGQGIDAAAFEQIVSAERVRAWAQDAAASDPDYKTLKLLRAPTGVLKDFITYAKSGEPWYDPAAIQCPTQVVVGELDRETTPEQGMQVFSQLSAAPEKRYTVIGGGTHTLLLENQRRALFDVVGSFLLSVC